MYEIGPILSISDRMCMCLKFGFFTYLFVMNDNDFLVCFCGRSELVCMKVSGDFVWYTYFLFRINV